MGEKIPCKMRPGDNCTGEFCQKRFIGDINVMFSKECAHFLVAVLPGMDEILQVMSKIRLVVINEKSHHVDIFSLVFCGKFYTGDDFRHLRRGSVSRGSFRIPDRPVQSVYGIMICEGEGSQSLFHRVID